MPRDGVLFFGAYILYVNSKCAFHNSVEKGKEVRAWV